MKIMSVYGLLGKIYNYNDDLPKRILFRDRIYELDDYNHYVYKKTYRTYGTYIDLFDETSSWELDDFLHEQVGIIENDEAKKKKLPEKLKIEQDTPSSNYYIKNEYGTKCALTKHSKIIADKVNELLDYLESKGE